MHQLMPPAGLRITPDSRSALRCGFAFATVLGPCTLTEPFGSASFVPFARIRRRLEYKDAPDRAVLRTNPASGRTSAIQTRYAKIPGPGKTASFSLNDTFSPTT